MRISLTDKKNADFNTLTSEKNTIINVLKYVFFCNSVRIFTLTKWVCSH